MNGIVIHLAVLGAVLAPLLLDVFIVLSASMIFAKGATTDLYNSLLSKLSQADQLGKLLIAQKMSVALRPPNLCKENHRMRCHPDPQGLRAVTLPSMGADFDLHLRVECQMRKLRQRLHVNQAVL